MKHKNSGASLVHRNSQQNFSEINQCRIAFFEKPLSRPRNIAWDSTSKIITKLMEVIARVAFKRTTVREREDSKVKGRSGRKREDQDEIKKKNLLEIPKS
ncbi:hypothetical protein CEXT_44291 [Caerostris extrusa]|uniref:Uncharacterized protein n=1 Tax=Caerostris extrusa TaxID=172846 RepID=A0AAV4QD18_CAEEX|nr:hypothetical protein CEXT_44291 [Caerostris extrusa]